MTAAIHVRRNPDTWLWEVAYDCCQTRPTRLHEWVTAVRIATGHRCPTPFAPALLTRPRLTATVR